MKRLISAVLAAAMLLCMLPAALAASDIENHWAKTYLTELHELEIINPSSSGQYTPDQPIARWEFMRYINRAFDFTEKASISFTDVPSGSAYYDIVATAVYYGYINGVGNNKMDPQGTLTREQAATILGRLHKYTPDADPDDMTFSDKSAVSSYARAYVAEAVALKYINGYPNGTFKPQGTITRGEIAKILYYFLGTSLHKEGGSYTGADLDSVTDNVSITLPCTLSNATIDGNLYITEGVGAGSVTLQNVTVEGRIIVSGGSVVLNGVSALDLTVSSPCDQTLSVTCSGNTSIAHTEVQSDAMLYESGLGISAGGLSDLDVNGENLSLTLDAALWDVNVKQACTILTTGSTTIDSLTADGKVTLTGGGSVQKAALNVSGCDLVMEPSTVELASGVTATIAGESVQSSNSISISPAALTFDAGNADSIAHSYAFTFNADKDDLVRITVDGDTLTLGEDYNLLTDKNGIRIYKTYLTTLEAGTYTAKLTFSDRSTAALTIITSNSGQMAVSPSQITFDKYEESAGYANVPLTVSTPAGVTLSSIKLGSTVLERGTDYTYNTSTGQVVLMAETLAKKSKGSYTISFVPSKGSTTTCSLTITDSKPVNKIAPEEVDFDANTSSGGYRDITVTLTPANGAELRRIRCNNKELEEDWQYKVSGNQVTLNKSAISEFAEKGASYADFTFVMSNGQNPTLRVNYVTTYALTASVVDDLGLPIEGASVTFTPADSATGTATQTATTDEDGKATVYVKRGSYTLTAAHERFTESISQTTSVSSSRTVKMTGEILENVQVVVTNKYGAMLSGAVVSIGGKAATTGADGVASFSLRRDNYVIQVSCSGYTTTTKPITVTGSIRTQVQLE